MKILIDTEEGLGDVEENIGWPQLSEACRGLNACMYICLFCVHAFMYARSTRALWRMCRPYARVSEPSDMSVRLLTCMRGRIDALASMMAVRKHHHGGADCLPDCLCTRVCVLGAGALHADLTSGRSCAPAHRCYCHYYYSVIIMLVRLIIT